jgi:Na+/H+-dicarboxylate symporter
MFMGIVIQKPIDMKQSNKQVSSLIIFAVIFGLVAVVWCQK